MNKQTNVAEAAREYLRVLAIKRIEADTCLLVPCADFEAYRALPDAVRFKGQVFGLTGWDSDREWACYSTDAALAKVVGGAA